jgi:hypothetical protein
MGLPLCPQTLGFSRITVAAGHPERSCSRGRGGPACSACARARMSSADARRAHMRHRSLASPRHRSHPCRELGAISIAIRDAFQFHAKLRSTPLPWLCCVAHRRRTAGEFTMLPGCRHGVASWWRVARRAADGGDVAPVQDASARRSTRTTAPRTHGEQARGRSIQSKTYARCRDIYTRTVIDRHGGFTRSL